MKTDMKHHIYILALLTALTSCADTLFDDSAEGRTDNDGIQFCVSTQEQNELTIALGQNHEADHYKAHAMTGDHTYGLKAVSMPLPLMGIHKGTVSAQSSQSAQNSPTTRAAYTDIVAIDGSNFHDSLTIWGYTYQPYKTGGTDADKCTIFNQILLKRITNWRSAAHWPYGGGSMKFYALAPSMENVNVQAAGGSFDTPPTLTYQLPDYTLPTATREMYDLLWGESEVTDIEALDKEANIGQDNKLVDLHFQHILTAIRFAQGNIPSGITIKQITLHNVNTKGDFNPAATDAATGTPGAWSSLSNTGSYTLYPNFTGTGTDANTYISDSIFFMIPHTVTSGAELQVVLEAKRRKYKTKGGNPRVPDGYADGDPIKHTLKCSLEGDVWKKGYTVTYKLTIGEVEDGYYMLAESPSAAPHSTSATNGTFPVHSYHSYWDYGSNTENTTHAVNWQIVGYSNTEPTEATKFTDSKPDWLTISGANSGTTGEFVGGNSAVANYTISGQSYVKSGSHSAILEANSTSDNNWGTIDLSTTTPNKTSITPGGQTANCYIVNHRGTFSFPLVYGNKSSNGDEASCFVDHKGAVIEYKSIQDQMTHKHNKTNQSIDDTHQFQETYTWNAAGENPTLRAVLLWQDIDGLISSVSALGSTNMMNFTVGVDKPGNAVIALQARTEKKYELKSDDNWVTDTGREGGSTEYNDNWETLWTWHIWMTDEVFPNYSSTSAINVNTQYLNNNENNGKTGYMGDHIVSITNWGSDGTNGTSSTILPVNLGWVPDEDEFGYYAHREVWVKLQQTEPTSGTPATTVVKIEQHARQPLITGTSTVYQWGRPTALPAVCYMNKSARPIYGTYTSNSTACDFTIHEITNPCEAIANPQWLCRLSGSGQNWFSTAQTYWGDGTLANKTVYDPCPPGFCIPNYTIFTGFSHTGATSNSGNDLNMWEDAGQAGKGAYFYTSPNSGSATANRYGQTVYMPATGQYRADKTVGSALTLQDGNNSVFTEASAGLLWSSGSTSTDGKSLWFYPQWTRTGDSSKPAIALPFDSHFSTAMPIRPTGNLLAY